MQFGFAPNAVFFSITHTSPVSCGGPGMRLLCLLGAAGASLFLS